ncbi:MAG: SIS domain-containing protein [Rickettsiales bacterium]|nr:SIS domain-containing protein [Rickettsiales bacterium]
MSAANLVDQSLAKHLDAIQGCVEQHRDAIAALGEKAAECIKSGNKILVCGNGGSACDALHFAGELVGRFVNDRKALPAMALTADPGILTAVGNDYGFEEVFARQIQAHGREGDLLIAISTSGSSQNILRALDEAKKCGMYRAVLTGEKGKELSVQESNIWVPSSVTAHIQETHIFVLQLLVAIMEEKLF